MNNPHFEVHSYCIAQHAEFNVCLCRTVLTASLYGHKHPMEVLRFLLMKQVDSLLSKNQALICKLNYCNNLLPL